jgi:hypothetical protein
MLHAHALARIQLLTCCVCVPPPPQPLHNHIHATCACVFIKFQRPGRCRGQFCFLLPCELTKGSLRAVHHSPALCSNVSRFLSACFNEMNSTLMQYVCFSSVFFCTHNPPLTSELETYCICAFCCGFDCVTQGICAQINIFDLEIYYLMEWIQTENKDDDLMRERSITLTGTGLICAASKWNMIL